MPDNEIKLDAEVEVDEPKWKRKCCR